MHSGFFAKSRVSRHCIEQSLIHCNFQRREAEWRTKHRKELGGWGCDIIHFVFSHRPEENIYTRALPQDLCVPFLAL